MYFEKFIVLLGWMIEMTSGIIRISKVRKLIDWIL